jgi:hypothetical protein
MSNCPHRQIGRIREIAGYTLHENFVRRALRIVSPRSFDRVAAALSGGKDIYK